MKKNIQYILQACLLFVLMYVTVFVIIFLFVPVHSITIPCDIPGCITCNIMACDPEIVSVTYFVAVRTEEMTMSEVLRDFYTASWILKVIPLLQLYLTIQPS